MLNYAPVNLKLQHIPSPPLWATHAHLTVIDAQEVGNMSVLAGCGGKFQPKVSSLFISGINMFYLQVNIEVFTSAFEQLRINAVYNILM